VAATAGVDQLVGRERELGELAHFLDAIPHRPAAVLLEGEPGIGKTVLWQATVAEAQARGYRVLAARPAEAEATLSFAVLGHLLADVTNAIGALPDPQRRVLRAALLLEDANGAPTDGRTLSAALLSLLRDLARDGPVLVAIDDAQWLDPQTATMLAYALRRLGSDPVGFLGAARARTAFGFDSLRRLPVTPLADESIAQIVRDTVVVNVPRPALDRLTRLAGGNPFYAGEFARALARREGSRDGSDAVPVPESLRDLIRERLDVLPGRTRAALVTVAALAHPTRELIESATGDARAVEPAVRVGVLELHGESVRLTHPCSPPSRTTTHRYASGGSYIYGSPSSSRTTRSVPVTSLSRALGLMERSRRRSPRRPRRYGRAGRRKQRPI
jgi:hypothetical protein